MKRLTIMVAVMLATLLVRAAAALRAERHRQSRYGRRRQRLRTDNGQDNSDQQVAPDQPPGGDEAADQNNDTNAAG